MLQAAIVLSEAAAAAPPQGAEQSDADGETEPCGISDCICWPVQPVVQPAIVLSEAAAAAPPQSAEQSDADGETEPCGVSDCISAGAVSASASDSWPFILHSDSTF